MKPFFRSASLCLGLFSLITLQPLNAEIQSLRLKWNPVACQIACTQALQPILTKIPEVQEVQFNPNFGEAELIWKPNAPFNLAAIVLPMRRYGLSIQAMNIKMRGNIVRTGSYFYVVSVGDNTRFLLLGPLRQGKGDNYVMARARENHPIEGDLKTRLIDAEKTKNIVDIEGSMFDIEKHELIIEIISAKVEKPEDQKQR